MDALLIQLNHEISLFNTKEKSIETLFIGGGTPSCVSPKLYKDIFKLLKPYLCDDIEITSEANPNSATKEWLKGMRELGVNRISFGVQSFDEKKLKILNRAHTPKMAIEAVLNAKQIGFENISLDIIYATIGDTKELLQKDIKTAFSLPINHISAYALTIEDGTAFENKPQMSNENLSLTKWIFEQISSKFQQYEISNFGDYHSKHNKGYWEYKDYIGLGAGAVGKLNLTRYYPHTDIEAYIKNPLEIREEKLSKEDKKIEQMFLGFRSIIGVREDILDKKELFKANILTKENKLEYKNQTYYNNDYLLADELVLFICS
jgi:oxygen-independent coproporphyrinogen-3 oxidase